MRKLTMRIACALTLVALLTGCTGTPAANDKASEAPSADAATTTTQAEATPAPQESADAPAAAAGEAGWEAFANEVTLTIPVYDRAKEGYPAVDDNYWTKWVQTNFGDKYNIKCKYIAIPRGDVMMKYSMLIAAGDTPTILMEYDYPKVAQWANDGAMTELDLDAFKAVAPNFYQAMVDNNQLLYTDINGKTYFVLTERPYYNTAFTYATFVRMDWLRAVGYDHVPKDYAEQKDAIQKIMDAKLTDHAPVGLSLPTAAYVANFAFRDFPVDEAEWAMHSSLGTPSLSWKATEKLLRRQNAEYNAGWYSKEYDLEKIEVGGGSSQMQTDFINGKIYRYGGYMSQNVSWLTAFYENNPDAELAIESQYQVEEPGYVDNVQIRADNPFGMIVGFSSGASEDQLKAAWMYMEWMLKPETLEVMENGIEGVTFKYDENGLPVVDNDYRGPEMLNHNNNIDMTCVVHASKKIGTIEETIKMMSPAGLPKDFSQDLIDNYYELQKIADAGRAYSDPVFAVAIDSESEYGPTLLSLYQEYSALLTKCKPEEFDAMYADLSKKFLDAGYQAVIDERLAAYNAGNCTKLPK